MLRKSTIVMMLSTFALAFEVQGDYDNGKAEELLKKLSTEQQRLAEQINELKEMLGLDDPVGALPLLPADDNMKAESRKKLEEGIRAYNSKSYEAAKESFQKAWEDSPDSAAAEFNLGLVYYKLGNTSLAKKMFKDALETDPALTSAEKVRQYVEGKNYSIEAEKKDTDEEKTLRTELINLKKEAESYMNSKVLPFPKRMYSSLKALQNMESKAKGHNNLIEEYYLEIADIYSNFELYDKSVELYGLYEKAMEGKVLPDGYHSRLLQLLEKQKEQTRILSGYLGNAIDREASFKLEKDMKELGIFAAQLDEFVKEAKATDPDFATLCQRLGEYRWGDHPNRHVLIINRYQELLWSSLPGTVALERYQDSSGEKFLKNITLLADKTPFKKTECFASAVTVNGTVVPYLILFTYVPKHEAFIVVRLPNPTGKAIR